MGSEEATDLVKRYYFLQKERVETYKLFEESYKAYLNGAPDYNFPMYRKLIHEITLTFKKISDEIISIQKKLSEEYGKDAISTYIRKIQEEEEKKLKITVKDQLAKQNAQDHPEENSYKEEVDQCKKELQEAIQRISEYSEELKYETEDLQI